MVCAGGGEGNAYTLIYTSGTNVRFDGAVAVTQGTATVGAPTIGPNLNQVTVPLTGVTDAQHLVVTLSGVEDTSEVTLTSQAARMGVLVGDTTGDGFVNSADISQTKSKSGQSVVGSNFRAQR